MKGKMTALLSQVQKFGMSQWGHGFNQVTNEDIAEHLIANNVVIQKKEPARVTFDRIKGYVLTTKTLPDILQFFMDEQDMDQKQLSIKSGLSQNTLRRCINDRECMSHFSLECLLEALGKQLVIVDKKDGEKIGR